MPFHPAMTEVQKLKMELIVTNRALHRERIVGSKLYLEQLDREEYELMDEVAKAAKAVEGNSADSPPDLSLVTPSGVHAAAHAD
jgi:hypothetical protein